MKLSIIGDIFGESGYAIHTRNLARALIKEGVDLGIETMLVPNWEFNCPDDMLKALNTDNRRETIIYVGQPQFWPIKLSERPKKFIGFLVFEGDKTPFYWKEICNRKDVDMIFVPSKHTKEACIKGGIDKNKIRIIPHGVDLSIFKPQQDKTAKKSPLNFRFLFVGGWAQGENDRKNLPFLLRAYCEEFNKDDEVELIIKINPVYNMPNFDFTAELDKLNLPKDRPKILLNSNLIATSDMSIIYNDCDVFVCPTKAEAFGMVFLEAMACGKPCIAGGYGGQVDFINEKNGWLIKDYKLVKSKDISEIYEETNWAEYDIKELRAILRDAYNHRNKVIIKGNSALNEAISRSWSNTAKEVIKCLS